LALGFALASGGSGVGTAAEPGSDGDRIQFSGAADAVRLPESDAASSRLSGALELLRKGDSLGGALDRPGGPAPSGAPRQNLSPRLLEQFDRGKNWVFNRPEDLTRLPTAEDVMKVWDYDLDHALGLGGAGADRVGLRSASRPMAPSTLDPDRSDSPVLPDRFDAGFLPGGGGKTGERVSPGFGFQPTPSAPLPLASGQFAAETRADPTGFTTSELFPISQRRRITSDVQDLLAPPKALNSFSPGFDPINLGVDSTRREIDPVTAPSLNELGAAQRFDTALSLPTPGAIRNLPSTLLDEMTAKILGPSSLSPALAAPSEPSKAKPRTTTRESFGRKL
jgi:hypothetical protein